MNFIWLVMVLFGYSVCVFSNPALAISAMTEAGTMSVSLTLNLLAINCVWLGVMNIVEKTGINDFIAKILRPVIRFLFDKPSIESEKYLALNMSANLLGLGSAATPMGISAMKTFDDASGIATNNMLMLVILNATSLQLLPTTIIALRAAAGSTSPADIVVPSLISSLFTTVLGVFLVKILNKKRVPRTRALTQKG